MEGSRLLFEIAKTIFPGGVNSPVRAFKSVGGDPFFVAKGEGPFLIDVDGNRYIDCVLSWGPLVMGHAHPEIVDAISHQASLGTSYGAPHEGEIKLGQLIKGAIPSIEMIRFVNSGTEAGMSVIRLARAFTGRKKILKFTGCYHGHVDSLLVQAGSGIATFSLPNSPGVIQDVTNHTVLARYNDLASVVRALDETASDMAGIILEPVVGNSGFIPPEPSFLRSLRDLTNDYGVLLIFDEVMTGFRVDKVGAQCLYDITPDLTMLGKVIGGGLPVGAYGGRKEIMEMVAPSGPVYQAGTLSGNPLAMIAGLKTLELWWKDDNFSVATESAKAIVSMIISCGKSAGISVSASSIGSMLGFFFHTGEVLSYEDALGSDRELFSRFFRGMLKRGVYIPPSPFEAWFVSALHRGSVLDQILNAIEDTFEELSM